MTALAAAMAVGAGALLQSAVGFGFALVAAPLLFALLGPEAAISAVTVLAVWVNLLTLAEPWTRRPRRALRVARAEAAALLGWALPGLFLGAWALRTLPERALDVAVGLAVLGALAVRLRGHRVATPPAPAAGLAAGALATSTGLSGPPLVLRLGARRAPAEVRDTLAVLFLGLALVAVPALLVAGAFSVPASLPLLLLAVAAGHATGRAGFDRLAAVGDRHERALLGVLALTAIGALVAGAVG